MDSVDHLVRAIDRERHVRVCAAITTGLVADAARRHELSPAATRALGRALTSGVLLATLTKGEERVTVQLIGDGPVGSITVDANGAGDVRGYALHPQAGADFAADRHVGDVVGRRGVVNVLRDLGLKELYQGQTSLLTGEVDEDIESYLRTSEQVPSALGCDVLLDASGRPAAAGGVLVQAMPGGDPDIVREVQHALRTDLLGQLLREGVRSANTIAERAWSHGPLEFVGGERGVRFHCRCSPERIGEMLALLGTVDLDEMIAENKPAEVVCNYCNTRYQIGRQELEQIRARVAGGPRGSN
ncbi:MAG TPA: Hsp33 family molecular chaperone HslO [Polyangia bacterium]|nr:Hsp33 family molecular chaperone HslO [Polyangia bacterium]